MGRPSTYNCKNNTKKCSKCNNIKKISEFYKDNRNLNDKSRHICKLCTIKQTNKYSKNNHKRTNLRDSIRYKKDINFKLRMILRKRLYGALRKNQKIGSAVNDLGCSIEDFRKYLERKFLPGMSWNNWGMKEDCWSIDHIKPLSKVNLENQKEFLEVAHYTNLQPMWHIENVRKGNR